MSIGPVLSPTTTASRVIPQLRALPIIMAPKFGTQMGWDTGIVTMNVWASHGTRTSTAVTHWPLKCPNTRPTFGTIGTILTIKSVWVNWIPKMLGHFLLFAVVLTICKMWDNRDGAIIK
jgi:hypothetical protein